MHNQQQHLKLNNIISKLAVIVLSIVLLPAIPLVSALQIAANGQSQHQQPPKQKMKIDLSQIIKQLQSKS